MVERIKEKDREREPRDDEGILERLFVEGDRMEKCGGKWVG